MPTTTSSQETLDELRRFIEQACLNGDSISAIADRAGVQRDVVSGLRNGTYRYSPTLDKFEAICKALNISVSLRKD